MEQAMQLNVKALLRKMADTANLAQQQVAAEVGGTQKNVHHHKGQGRNPRPPAAPLARLAALVRKAQSPLMAGAVGAK
jgi:hypothetical protein